MPDEPPVSDTFPSESAEQHLRRPAASTSPLESPLFRFDLRQLLWFVAVLSGVLAAIVSLPGLTAAALLLAVLVVAAHIFSTVLATRLRTQTDERQRLGKQFNAARDTAALEGSAEHCVAPTLSFRRSPWHRRGSTSLPWLKRLILAGIMAGAMVGALLLAATIGNRTSTAGMLVGSASLAVVGGWFAFLCGSFYGIFRHGLRDALADQRKDESPRRMSG